MTTIEFCYGHRLKGHQGKCATLHGHNATVELYAAPHPDRKEELIGGMVVDFSLLKEKIGGWIDQYWDHTTILERSDRVTVELISQCPSTKPLFILDGPPTAEMLANYLFKVVCPTQLKGYGIVVYKINFWENPRSMASAEIQLNDRDNLINLYGTLPKNKELIENVRQEPLL